MRYKTGWVIALTGVGPPMAALGDRDGRRNLHAAGLGRFTLVSALCALASGVGWLIAARAAQGVGAALLMPPGVALLSALTPPIPALEQEIMR